MSRRFGYWFVRHRRIWPLHRLVHTGGRCFVCRAVWADIESDPDAVASLERGRADHEAGRWYHYDTTTGESTPNPDWPKTGPQPR